MERRSFIRVLGGGMVLAAAPAMVACSSALPPEAVAAWQAPAPPAAGSDVRRWILAHAILAPHSHNLQSWLVDLRQPGEIALYCDRTRLLPETDPFSRQIMMSQGTFLEVLDLAARQQGLSRRHRAVPQRRVRSEGGARQRPDGADPPGARRQRQARSVVCPGVPAAHQPQRL